MPSVWIISRADLIHAICLSLAIVNVEGNNAHFRRVPKWFRWLSPLLPVAANSVYYLVISQYLLILLFGY